MNGYARSRRTFLAAVGVGSGLACLLRNAEARAAGQRTQRLILSLRPCGTIRNEWLPKGSGRTFTFGSILAPFERWKDKTVVLDGLNNVTNGAHEPGLLGMTTGAASPKGLYGIGGRASFDQVLVEGAPTLAGAGFKSLQLAGDTRCEHQVQRVISYSGPNAPLEPENDPAKVYRRVFGSLMAGGAESAAANEERLRRARARKKSVLDFARADLARLAKTMPASEREKIDTHTAVIRDLETAFDRALSPTGAGGACATPMAPESLPVNSNQHHATLCKLHAAVMGAALACDLTRVVSVAWAPVVSHVGIQSVVPGRTQEHHELSHGSLGSASVAQPLAAMDRFYTERIADVLTKLEGVPDPVGGTYLDSTLVVHFSEIAHGGHSPTNIPIALVGGKGVGLQGGQSLAFGGRPTSDMWLAIGAAFGVDLSKAVAQGDRRFSALQGVFAGV